MLDVDESKERCNVKTHTHVPFVPLPPPPAVTDETGKLLFVIHVSSRRVPVEGSFRSFPVNTCCSSILTGSSNLANSSSLALFSLLLSDRGGFTRARTPEVKPAGMTA